ncbi:MAG TPA: pitrilysin family protein [Bryobacteraceae bacterium]|nr:pitrilysin family protein [Bryobacteraceae bacterium]
MTRRLIFLTFLAALLGAQTPDSARPAPAPVRPFKIPGYSETTLPNGMTVILVQDERFPLITARLVFAGGSKRDPKDMPGISSAFASLLLRGTSSRSARQFTEDLDSIGGVMTATARPDSIAIEATALKESTGSLLILVSDILRGVEFPEQEVDAYRRARAQALRNEAAQPGAIAARVLSLAIFGPGHYGAGDPAPQAMDLLDRQAISDYRGLVFVPGNTTLIMAGALPAQADLMKALTYVFGSWSETKPPPYVPPKPIEPKGRLLVVDRPGTAQAEIRIGRTSPSFANADTLPLQIASAIVGGNAESRLAAALHDTLKPGDEVRTDVNALADAGAFSAVARVRNEIVGEVLEKTMAELNRIVNEPVDAAELANAKSAAIGAFLARMETQQNLADLLAMAKLAGAGKDYIESYTSRVSAVDAARVQDVAKRWMAPDKAVVVVVGDAAKIRDQLAKVGTFETVDAFLRPAAAGH